MPVVKGATGSVKLSNGKLLLAKGIELGLDELNVEVVFSWLAACAAKKIIEEIGLEPLEVRLEAYVDLDKLLDGREEIEYIIVTAVYPEGSKKPEGGDVLKAVLKCPIMGLFKEKIKGAIVESRRTG